MKRVLTCLLVSATLFALTSCALLEQWDTPDNTPYRYDLSEYVTLGAYKGLTVPTDVSTVTEKELNAQIEEDFAAAMQLFDRELKMGDTVNLNYVATFENETYDDDTENGFRITLGKNELGIEGFDEGLVDSLPGDSIALDLTFPDEYPRAPEYAGKDVSFVVTINYICIELPELTDEFVSDYTGYKDRETYLAATRKMLSEIKSVDYLWQRVMDGTSVLQYPDKEYETYHNEYIETYTSLAAGYNMTLNEMIEESGKTMGDFYDEADETVKLYLKEDMIVYAVAREENITVTEEEYNQGVTEYFNSTGAQYYLSQELMVESIGREVLEGQILSNKVLDFIRENAVYQEG